MSEATQKQHVISTKTLNINNNKNSFDDGERKKNGADPVRVSFDVDCEMEKQTVVNIKH